MPGPRTTRLLQALASLPQCDWAVEVRDIRPKAWSRPRTRGGNPGNGMITLWTAFHMKLWRRAMERRPSVPLDGPLFCVVEFCLRRPKRGAENLVWCDKKPDADNLLKGVGDMLEQAKVVKNDSRIVVPVPVKLYSDTEGVRVRLWKLD